MIAGRGVELAEAPVQNPVRVQKVKRQKPRQQMTAPATSFQATDRQSVTLTTARGPGAACPRSQILIPGGGNTPSGLAPRQPGAAHRQAARMDDPFNCITLLFQSSSNHARLSPDPARALIKARLPCRNRSPGTMRNLRAPLGSAATFTRHPTGSNRRHPRSCS